MGIVQLFLAIPRVVVTPGVGIRGDIAVPSIRGSPGTVAALAEDRLSKFLVAVLEGKEPGMATRISVTVLLSTQF